MNTQGNWTYLHTHLTHIEDIEKYQTFAYPKDVIAEIEFAYSTYTIIMGEQIHTETVLLKSDATPVFARREVLFNKALESWFLLVKDAYYKKLRDES
jgi:hypothetical protein